MKDPMKFRRYAEDCRRLSNTMNPEHKTSLLEMADAWDRAAEEAEREVETKEREKRIGRPRASCIFLSYKSSEKEAWDDIVTRISLSLRPR